MNIKKNKTYIVDHSRKGLFTIRVESVEGEWVGGVIVSGKANALCESNIKRIGEKILIRKSLCKFTEVKKPKVLAAPKADLPHEMGKCPKCGGTLEYGDSYPENEDYCYEWSCKCGASGKEWYSMKFIEHTIN
jgi:hypothetical protein